MPTIYKNGLIYGGAAGSASLIQATDVNGNASNVQAELDKFNVIDSNPSISHNNIYRGIMLVDTVENTGKYTLTQLHNLVSAGDFSDIYVGDIIKVNRAAVTYTPTGGSSTTDPAQVVEWIVMGINTQLGIGTPPIGNHIVLVPRDCFITTAHMNSTNITTGGYEGSDMHTTILPAYQNAVSASLGDYVLPYETLLTNRISQENISGGHTGYKGIANSYDWHTGIMVLLNEVEITGIKAWSSSGFDVAERNCQLPGFRLNHYLITKGYGFGDTTRQDIWWTSSVFSKDCFIYAGTGDCGFQLASNNYGIVPKVLFG